MGTGKQTEAWRAAGKGNGVWERMVEVNVTILVLAPLERGVLISSMYWCYINILMISPIQKKC